MSTILQTEVSPRVRFKENLGAIREMVTACQDREEGAYFFRLLMEQCHALSKAHDFQLDGSAIRRASDPALRAELRNKLR